jgi:nicotinamidase-related amidase
MPAPSTRHKSKVALILVDVINHFEFPDGARLLRNALPMAPKLARLKKRAREAGIPAIYVNDNFGQWRSDATKLVDYCVRAAAPGKMFVEEVQPDHEDYFVLKPMHSAFYQTPLEVLLRYLSASTLVVCGLATNSCVVCTAQDAKMRDFRIVVPSDCSAARTRREHLQALQLIKAMEGAKVMASFGLRFETLAKNPRW